MPSRTYGRLHRPDSRDKQHMLRRFGAAPTRRKSQHWRLGPIMDQGNTSHCVGYSWYGWLTAEPLRQHPILPSGIYTMSQYLDEWDGTDYDGTSVRGGAKALTVTGHISEYQWAWTLDDAVQHVLDVSPLVIGVNWYAKMEDTDADGFIHVGGRLRGGHAVLLYGVNTRSGFASIRNSWGPDWGKRGNCRISLEDFEKLLGEDGECCTAIESRV